MTSDLAEGVDGPDLVTRRAAVVIVRPDLLQSGRA
jgi:hypothetical protein